MLQRRILAAVVLPLAAFLAAASWYGLRAGMWHVLVARDAIAVDPFAMAYQITAWGRVGSLVLGGVLAALIGGQAAAAPGLALAATGALVFGLGPEVTRVPALILAAFGSGLATPGLWSAAASAFAQPTARLREALCFALYIALQIGAFTASQGASWLSDGPWVSAWFAGVALTGLLGALLLGVAATLHHVLPAIPKDDPTERLRGMPVLVSGVLLVTLLAPYTALWVVNHAVTAFVAGSSFDPTLIWTLNPIVVTAVALLALVAALALHATGLDLPGLLWVGAGCLLAAAGAGLGAVTVGVSVYGGIAAMGVLAVAEALLLPSMLACLLGEVHWRVAGPLAGLWLALGGAASNIIPPLGDTLPPAPLLGGCAVLLALFGVLTLVAAVPLQRLARLEPAAAPEAD